MKTRWSCKLRQHAIRVFGWLTALAAILAFAPAARADAPVWLRALTAAPLSKYSEETDAVILLDERIITVKDSGETKTLYRRAYKILRPEARRLGHVVVLFDTETRLTYLKAWCIPAQGKEFEVKVKDAVETSAFSGELFADARAKILTIPAADPGNIIGYEYEQKDRPHVLQGAWWFQGEYPLREGRLTLQLPSGWEYKAHWLNHAGKEPVSAGNNQWRWDVADVPAVQREPQMPPRQAVEARLFFFYYPATP